MEKDMKKKMKNFQGHLTFACCQNNHKNSWKGSCWAEWVSKRYRWIWIMPDLATACINCFLLTKQKFSPNLFGPLRIFFCWRLVDKMAKLKLTAQRVYSFLLLLSLSAIAAVISCNLQSLLATSPDAPRWQCECDLRSREEEKTSVGAH